jgi:hypothetical protein
MPIEKPSIGPVIAIVVIVVLLILGAFYVWSGKDSGVQAPTSPVQTEVPRNDLGASVDDQQVIDDLNFDDVSSDINNIK